MTSTAEITALLLDLPSETRATLAVELIDSLHQNGLEDTALGDLAEERDAELENGAVIALTYDEFMAGIRRALPPS